MVVLSLADGEDRGADAARGDGSACAYGQELHDQDPVRVYWRGPHSVDAEEPGRRGPK